MSDARRCIGLILLGCGLLPAVARGQDQAALQARAELLRREVAVLSQRVNRRDSLARTAIGWDSLAAGALEVYFPVRDHAIVRQAAVRALDSIAPLLGERGTRRLGIRVAAGTQTGQPGAMADSGWEVSRLLPSRPGTPRTASFVVRSDSVAGIAAAIARIAPEALWAQADTTLLSWLSSPPQVRLDSAALRAAYIALATRPERVARRCFAEESAACSASLGLLPPGSELSAWYDAEERRDIFRALLGSEWEAPHWSAEARACAMTRELAICDRLLGEQNPLSLPAPLAVGARGALVTLALESGGEGAMDRLLAAPDTPLPQRLAAAASLPYDSLLMRWRVAVGAARPEPVGPGIAPSFTAFGWTALLLCLAIGGSRWRDR